MGSEGSHTMREKGREGERAKMFGPDTEPVGAERTRNLRPRAERARPGKARGLLGRCGCAGGCSLGSFQLQGKEKDPESAGSDHEPFSQRLRQWQISS